jgi:hypothetical protein
MIVHIAHQYIYIPENGLRFGCKSIMALSLLGMERTLLGRAKTHNSLKNLSAQHLGNYWTAIDPFLSKAFSAFPPHSPG